MKSNIIKRVLDETFHIINTGDTIREIAKIYGVSKSTVHKDLNERLYELDIDLYKRVSDILKYHIDVRHIRGGESTRIKYLKLSNF
ncbi:MAG: sporulation transcriptional regulator SpoIIID [Bacilli bacterium]|nr:sporulation transcriptional regulator SpoIIID [Bacilli bacterium]MDD4298097.1 sporulation transcriptional regulator SpoIIID [Bacilli bacterium]MDD4643967.1 sporulation transcriptional regulator SpoIIID [Bacilli bacterium]